MGERGPKKTPASTKKRRGTFRKDRDAEPVQFEAGIPPIPKSLHPEAAKEWERLAPIVVKKGLLTEADWLAWTLGFESLSTWFQAGEEVAKPKEEGGGAVHFTEKGYPAQNPWVAIGQKAYGSVMKFCREFGLTPSSRSGLKLEVDEPEEDAFAEAVKQRSQH